MTIKAIAPFYNDDTDAPPPLPHTLTDQLELFGKMPHPTGLLADELLPTILGVGGSVAPSKAVAVKPAVRLCSPRPAIRLCSPGPTQVRQASPYPKKPHSHRAASKAPISSDKDLTDSTISELESSDGSISDDAKISKPPGEAGRPGRGGYTLKTALDWHPRAYSKFKKSMHALIDEHLDISKCASAQKATLLGLVREKAIEQFPDLENYGGCWPVTDMIMMRLKYTSSRARRQELEMAAGKSKKIKKK